jgi:hypothetical protein
MRPPNSTEAYICSYECPFCERCVNIFLENVCPNYRGEFEKRPVRPKNELLINPASTTTLYKPIPD